jgi:hypothetical protein
LDCSAIEQEEEEEEEEEEDELLLIKHGENRLFDCSFDD